MSKSELPALARFGQFIDNRPILAVFICAFTSGLSIVGVPLLWLAMVVIAYSLMRGNFVIYCASSLAAIAPFLILLPSDFTTIATLLLIYPVVSIYSKFRSFDFQFEIMILACVIFIAVLHLIFPDLTSWWISKYQDLRTALLKDGAFSDLDVDNIINTISKISTGITLFAMTLNLFFTNFIAAYMSDLVANNKHEILYKVLKLKLGYISPTMSVFLLLGILVQYYASLDIISDLSAYIFGIMIFYGIIILIGISNVVFKTRAWVILMSALIFVLALSSNLAKLFLMLLAVSDFFADWRTVFQGDKTQGSSNK